MNARTVVAILDTLFKLNQNSIISYRPVTQRMISTCRDFSVLACAILRSNGVAARVRYGFSKYYFSQFFHDIVLLEYWNMAKNCWCLVDTRTTEAQVEHHKFNVAFDLHDIPLEQFISAASAWNMCRKGEIKATKFGSGSKREIKGLWYIRNKLMQDLAALNKHELLLWDSWGYILHNKYGVDPYAEDELNNLDSVAQLLDCANIDIGAINHIYKHPSLGFELC